MKRRILSSRPSPAMVVACIALIVALGGTGYAAIKLPRNSVGNKQLRANAVTSAKVRNGALTAKDFQSSALKRGPRGAPGPKGDSAPGAGFASRDLFASGGGNQPVPLGAALVDLIGLDVGAGTSGYTASSGRVKVTGPSRLIANGQAVITNADAASGNVICRISVVGAEPRAIGHDINALVGPGVHLPVAVSAGGDIDAGAYDVRLQCSSGRGSGMSFHRGNLTVMIAAR